MTHNILRPWDYRLWNLARRCSIRQLGEADCDAQTPCWDAAERGLGRARSLGAFGGRLGFGALGSLRRTLRCGRFGGFETGVVNSEVVLSGFVSEPSSADEPLHRLANVLFDAPARFITEPQVALRGRAFLLG